MLLYHELDFLSSELTPIMEATEITPQIAGRIAAHNASKYTQGMAQRRKKPSQPDVGMYR